MADGEIYYNATILSNLLDYRERTGDVHGAALLKQVSPVAWQHLNFYGRYEFRKGPEVIDINEVVKELSQMQVVPELVSTA